jgi:hypothetical protein
MLSSSCDRPRLGAITSGGGADLQQEPLQILLIIAPHSEPGKLGTSWLKVCYGPTPLEDDMNKKLLLMFAAASLLAAPSFAQNPPAADRPNNNAVNSSGQNNSAKPVSGANSFTEGQAKSKIEQAGYTNVTALKKDDAGVWRGKASKGGASTNVSLDFQGNVNAAK